MPSIVGVISDTHGTLPARALDLFAGAAAILHAGDVGDPEILDALGEVAPVTAVYGNVDRGALRDRLPLTASLRIAGLSVVVTHGHQFGSPTPAALREAHSDAGLICYGHTHRPLVERLGSTLVVNPGSAGSPRRGHRASVARVEVRKDGRPVAEILSLEGR